MLFLAVQSVLSLSLLILVGWLFFPCSWFGEEGASFLTKFTVRICIPCYMTYTVYTTCESPQALLTLVKSLPIPISYMLISLACSLALSRLFRVEISRRGVFINACTFCNCVIVGFPVVEALFGAELLPKALIYYMANTILFWSLGVYYLRRDSGNQVPLLSLEGIKKIFSPAIVMFLVGCALVLLNLTIPDFLFTPLEMLSKASTPLAMVFIGGIIRNTNFKASGLSRDLLAILGMRFLFSPLLMAAICLVLPIPSADKMVFFVFSTMPAMTQLGIMAKESGSDYRFASAAVGITTLLSMVSIPLYMWLMQATGIFA